MIEFGAYLLLERLGKGSQGDVYLARPLAGPPLPVVIKRLASQHRGKQSFMRRFKHEASIAAAIDSPHVVKVFDAGEVGGWLYIAMEYVAGRTLSKVVAELARDDDRPSLSSVADVITGALAGLHALHTAVGPDGARLEIVHRDVAPKNLMLSDEGVTKVIDLGLGKSNRQDWRTATGIVMGTPGYLAPEQASGEVVDPRADVFAMGAIFFELLTFKRYIPIRPIAEMLAASVRSHYRPPSSIRPDVPPAVDQIVERALELDPALRFQSAQEMADAIEAAIPIRAEQPARSLLDQLEWNDVAQTKAAVHRMIAESAGHDSISTLQAPPSEPVRSSRSISMMIAGLLLLLLGAGVVLWAFSPAEAVDAAVIEAAEPPKPPAVVPLPNPPEPEAEPEAEPEPVPELRAKEKRARVKRTKKPPATQPTEPAPPPTPPPPAPILDVEI